ncbi:MAG TPA: heme exporter protein CcmD [Terricaulis sp.]|jgi:heme exporter protein CcmD|nr:heme exporter protein CcmD [Terricaulis sp.]
MIEGGWPFVWASYALMGGAFAALIVVVLLRARHWAREARKLDRP